MKYLLRSIALSLLWLSVGLACKKDVEPQHKSCKDGTCCGSGKQEFELVVQVTAEPADLVADLGSTIVTGVVLKTDFRQPGDIYPSRGGYLCSLSADKVQGLVAAAKPGGPFSYKYRVWGAMYRMNVLTITGEPFDFFYVDRIEKMP